MKLIVTGYRLLYPNSPEYKEMKDYLLWSGHKHFNVWSESGKGLLPLGTHTYELDEKHLFDDQVNTVCGKRIHDWADYMIYTSYTAPRWGHYIENLDELNDLRRTYFKCGYCGHTDKVGGWCEKCRGSEYLTPDHHHLLWMRRLTTKPEKRKVPAKVLSSIEEAQQATAKRLADKAIARKRADLVQKAKDIEVEAAFLEHCLASGLTNITLDNLIFYSFKQTFSFGWRKPLSKEEATSIREKLGETPQWKIEFTTGSA